MGSVPRIAGVLGGGAITGLFVGWAIAALNSVSDTSTPALENEMVRIEDLINGCVGAVEQGSPEPLNSFGLKQIKPTVISAQVEVSKGIVSISYITGIEQHGGHTCGIWGHAPNDATQTTLAWEDVRDASENWHLRAMETLEALDATSASDSGHAIVKCRTGAPSFWAVSQPIFPMFRQFLPEKSEVSKSISKKVAFGFSAHRLSADDCQATLKRAAKFREEQDA